MSLPFKIYDNYFLETARFLFEKEAFLLDKKPKEEVKEILSVHDVVLLKKLLLKYEELETYNVCAAVRDLIKEKLAG